MKNYKSNRHIDPDYFEVGAIWYYKSPFWFATNRENGISGFYQVLKKKPATCWLTKIYLRGTFNPNLHYYPNIEMYRKEMKENPGSYKPIYGAQDPRGTSMRILYGKTPTGQIWKPKGK